MDARNNCDLIRELYAAFGKGDVPTVLAAFDPNIRWVEAENSPLADQNPYIGPQTVLEGVFMRLGSEVDGFTVTPSLFTDGGDTVLVEGRYTGKVKSTGTLLDAQFAHVWRLHEGKVVSFQQYTDSWQWNNAFGK